MELNERVKLAIKEVSWKLTKEHDRLQSLLRVVKGDVETICFHAPSYNRAEERFMGIFRHLSNCQGLLFTKTQLPRLIGKKKKIGKSAIRPKILTRHTNNFMQLVKAWTVFGRYRGQEEYATNPYDRKQIDKLFEEMSERDRRLALLEQSSMITNLNQLPNADFSDFLRSLLTGGGLLENYRKFYDVVVSTHNKYLEHMMDKDNYEFPNNLKFYERVSFLEQLQECYNDCKATLLGRD